LFKFSGQARFAPHRHINIDLILPSFLSLANRWQPITQKVPPWRDFGWNSSKLRFFFAFLYPVFASANAFVAAFAAVIAQCRITGTAIFRVLQWHAAFAAFVGFFLHNY